MVYALNGLADMLADLGLHGLQMTKKKKKKKKAKTFFFSVAWLKVKLQTDAM